MSLAGFKRFKGNGRCAEGIRTSRQQNQIIAIFKRYDTDIDPLTKIIDERISVGKKRVWFAACCSRRGNCPVQVCDLNNGVINLFDSEAKFRRGGFSRLIKARQNELALVQQRISRPDQFATCGQFFRRIGDCFEVVEEV